MSEAGPTYTWEQALRWRERWSEGDRSRIRQDGERLGVTHFVAVRSDARLHAKTADGTTRMYVNPGYLEYLAGAVPPDAEMPAVGYPYVVLSSFQARGPVKDVEDAPRPVCPSCFMELPVSGRCGSCEC